MAPVHGSVIDPRKFIASPAAITCPLLRTRISDGRLVSLVVVEGKLRLAEYGLEVLERNPSSFSPFPDGRYLLLGPDAAISSEACSSGGMKTEE